MEKLYLNVRMKSRDDREALRVMIQEIRALGNMSTQEAVTKSVKDYRDRLVRESYTKIS